MGPVRGTLEARQTPTSPKKASWARHSRASGRHGKKITHCTAVLRAASFSLLQGVQCAALKGGRSALGHDVALELLEAEFVEHVLGGLVHLARPHLGVEGRHVWHEVEAPLTLLLLELERDAPDGARGDALHEVGGESGNLIAHALGGHDRHLVHDALVGVEVQGQLLVVLLHNDARVALHGLGTDTPGVCGQEWWVVRWLAKLDKRETILCSKVINVGSLN
mmetsp:Transcript_64359/g.145164  ORF Transcript_64359/g.145164 Transcript_64359/m.145164 type:complete len:222 (+) Transcript_64359:177-842(+)